MSAGSGGLVEDLANAIGCPVAVLTGQPYLPVDRATADALAVVPGIRLAVCDDPLDLSARPRPVAFGPINVALWTLSVGADLGEGPRDYERVHHDPLDVDCLNSRERTGSYHFDCVRALAQHGGDRDDEAIRHLDPADQAAPLRMRNHPIVRELTEELTQRARKYLREVDSLLDRFGLTGQRSQAVNS